MEDYIKVIDIKNDTVYLLFPDNTTKKYLKDNFIIEPCIGQYVKIVNNGLFMNVKKEEIKESSQGQKLLSVILLVGYIIYVIYSVLKTDYSISFLTVYIFAYLIVFIIYAFSNKTIAKEPFKIMSIILGVIFILIMFATLWLTIACNSFDLAFNLFVR